MVEELRAAWSGLRGSADQFSELASACLPQALSPCAALASLSTDLYLDILRGELRQPDDPQQVTARTIDAMDAIVQRDQGPAFLELFDGCAGRNHTHTPAMSPHPCPRRPGSGRRRAS